MIDRLLDFAALYVVAWCLIIFTTVGGIAIYHFIGRLF